MKLISLLLLTTSLLFSTIKLPNSFHANFTQTITNPKGKVIKYRGKVKFSDKKVFKWSYTKPTKKEVCTNGVDVIVVDHDLEQVSSYYIQKGINISKILKNAKLHTKNIYVAQYEKKKYTIQIIKKKLQSIAYFDNLDNKVQIVFQKMRYTKGKLSNKSMKCNYPKSYDMIRG